MTEADHINRIFWGAFTPPDRRHIWEWANDHVTLPASLRSQRFSIDVAPWLKEPCEWITDGHTKELTLLKAVQGAGSTLGEIAIPYWIANDPGPIMYNWESTTKALSVWDERTSQIIEKTKPVADLLPSAKHRSKRKRGHIIFPSYFLLQQGTDSLRSVQSKSVRYLVNEECWDWKAGRLKEAYYRVTAAWNRFILNISQGSFVGDELHQKYEAGDQREAMVKCPACGKWFAPHFRVIKGKFGGMHWDSSEKIRNKDGSYNMNKLIPSIYLEADCCGHRVYDTPSERKGLNRVVKYSEPMNSTAATGVRSAHYEAVLVDWIKFGDIVTSFFDAQKAMKWGDIDPYIQFVQKREAKFYDKTKRPTENTITLSAGVKKSDTGLGEDSMVKTMAVDKQAGSARKGDTSHYWVTIRDWNSSSSVLMWEGRVNLDADVEELRGRYGVEPRFVFVDSGFNATEVYRFCAKYDYNAIKGEERRSYLHDNGDGAKIRKLFSELQYVDAYSGTDQAGSFSVPLILYSKQEIRFRLDNLKRSEEFDFQIPEDVSQHYKDHSDAEGLKKINNTKTGQPELIWHQYRPRNDLFVCECYQVLIADIAQVIQPG